MAKKNRVQVWVIEVNEYGAFLFKGTEKEAKERLRDKCEWEGESGDYRPATKQDIELLGGIE